MFRRLSPVVFVLALLVSSRAHSQTLYAVTSAGQLLTVDTSTGVGTLRAAISPAMQPTGLGFRGPDLYVTDINTSWIRQVDPVSGARIRDAVAIGGTGFGPLGNEEGDITFQADGLGVMSRIFGDFRTFNVITGTISAKITLAPTYEFDGLAVDPAGKLYGFRNTLSNSEIYTIDPPLATFVGATRLTPKDNLGGLAFHPTTGVLYAATANQSTSTSTLFQVNKTTGEFTPIGSIGVAGVTGLSFSPPPVPPPPPPPPPQPPVTWTPSPPPEGNFGTGAGGGEGGFGRLVRQGSAVVNVSARVQAAEVTEPATSGAALVSILGIGAVVLLVIGGGVLRKTLAG